MRHTGWAKKWEDEEERKQNINFAKNGGTPKNAPHCYGHIDLPGRTRRQIRSCNTCDNILRDMCREYGMFMQRTLEANQKEMEFQKDFILEQYEVKAQGKLSTPSLARKMFRARD